MHAVESLGLSSYPPAYLSEEAQSNNKSLLHGANFASGAAGYLDATAALYVRDVLHYACIVSARVSSYLRNRTDASCIYCCRAPCR
jgi:hypothetical protein